MPFKKFAKKSRRGPSGSQRDGKEGCFQMVQRFHLMAPPVAALPARRIYRAIWPRTCLGV